MPLVVRKFPGLFQLNEYLSGTLMGGPTSGFINPGLFLHGLTLVFTAPVSATVTFASTPAGAQIPISAATIKSQIEAQAAGVEASWGPGGSLQLRSSAGTAVTITGAGTANPLLGFSTSSPSSAAPANAPGGGQPEFVGVAGMDGGGVAATFNESSGGPGVSSSKFHLFAKSGVIAASLAANSVLAAWRNPSSTIIQDFERLIIKWETIAGYTAEQELGIDVLPVSSFVTANYAGGTDLSHPTTLANKAYLPLNGGSSVLVSGNVMIATTAGLTHGGAPIIATHPWMWGSFKELANAATNHTGFIELLWETGLGVPPWPIGSDAGFVVRNPIALGAGGTGRLSIEAVWTERTR